MKTLEEIEEEAGELFMSRWFEDGLTESREKVIPTYQKLEYIEKVIRKNYKTWMDLLK